MKYYSDLACEVKPVDNFSKKNDLEFGCREIITKIDSQKKSIFYCKPRGEYYSLDCPNLYYLGSKVLDYMVERLSNYIKNKVNQTCKKKKCKILIVCLGNENLVCDSLGGEVFQKLIICNQTFTNNELFAIQPSVFGKTNIKSVEHIEAVCQKVQPDICILIDSLCSSSMSRIGNCVQVSDSGILAGGAINRNNNTLISKKTLGVPTLCIGVPMVVRMENVFNDFVSSLSDVEIEDNDAIYSRFKDVIVAPKNIDQIVNQASYLISSALNLSLLDLTIEEQKSFYI